MTTILTKAHFVTEVTGQAIDVSSITGFHLYIASYDEQADTVAVELNDASPCDGQHSLVPAALLPFLLREVGAPREFLGRAFLLSK